MVGGEVLDRIVDGGGRCGVQFRQKGKGKAFVGPRQWPQGKPLETNGTVCGPVANHLRNDGDDARPGQKRKLWKLWKLWKKKKEEQHLDESYQTY